MKIAALILGILGGIIGLFVSLFGSIIAIGGAALGSPDSGFAGLVWATLGFSVLGIISGSLAIAKPRIAGKFLIISGIGGLISSSIFYIISAPLMVIAGIFALLGSRSQETLKEAVLNEENVSEEKKPTWKKWWVWVIAIVIIAGIASGGDSDTNKSTNSDIAKQTSTETQETKTYKIGESATIGKTGWKVLEVKDLGQTLKSDNEFIEPKQTSGRFIKIRFSVKNLDDSPHSISGLALIDSKDKKYDPYTESSGFIPDNEDIFIAEQLNPNIEKNLQVIYEVPKDSAGLKIRLYDLSDSFSDNIAYVNTGI